MIWIFKSHFGYILLCKNRSKACLITVNNYSLQKDHIWIFNIWIFNIYLSLPKPYMLLTLDAPYKYARDVVVGL